VLLTTWIRASGGQEETQDRAWGVKL
jgi:hypothetical protein